jgi:hypothetical protein
MSVFPPRHELCPPPRPLILWSTSKEKQKRRVCVRRRGCHLV